MLPQHPFASIALSCSGGGYRAATFHLGSMSYLNRLRFKGKPLLENVKLISTVSGGTITGAVYALQKQEGKSFEEIYHFLLDNIRKLDLVKTGIVQLNPDSTWLNPDKRKNLINAFAEQYDRHFTKGATFADFNEMKSHLEAVIFNSTEFDNGINFRFRSKGSGIFGNYSIRIAQEVAEQVKVADAIASSSAFPGGFEPMIWPDDFRHDRADKIKELAAEGKSTGLMDGGIYDNQGIDSILNYKSKNDPPYFDLVIISDVTSPYMDPFQPAVDKPKEGIRNLKVKDVMKKIRRCNKWIGVGLLAFVAVFAALPFILGKTGNFLAGVSFTLAGLGVILLIVKRILILRIRKGGRELGAMIKRKIPPFYFDKLSNLKIEELSVRRAEPLIADRINSVITLLMDIFLKVVRRLNYGKVYNDERFEYRRVSNLIRELTQEDYEKKNKVDPAKEGTSSNYLANSVLQGPYEKVVGPEIKKVAELACTFGTTLWFTDDDNLVKMLDTLVATGQVTMCYNMLEYLEMLIYEEGNGFAELAEEEKAAVMALHKMCLEDWGRFKVETFFLLKDFESRSLSVDR